MKYANNGKIKGRNYIYKVEVLQNDNGYLENSYTTKKEAIKECRELRKNDLHFNKNNPSHMRIKDKTYQIVKAYYDEVDNNYSNIDSDGIFQIYIND